MCSGAYPEAPRWPTVSAVSLVGFPSPEVAPATGAASTSRKPTRAVVNPYRRILSFPFSLSIAVCYPLASSRNPTHPHLVRGAPVPWCNTLPVGRTWLASYGYGLRSGLRDRKRSVTSTLKGGSFGAGLPSGKARSRTSTGSSLISEGKRTGSRRGTRFPPRPARRLRRLALAWWWAYSWSSCCSRSCSTGARQPVNVSDYRLVSLICSVTKRCLETSKWTVR